MDGQQSALAVGKAMLVAFSSHDPERFDAAFDPNVVVVDHRPLSWGEVDLDRFREIFLAAWEMSPDVGWRVVQDLGSTPLVSRAVIEMRGTRDGGPFETSFLGLIEVRGLVVTRLETFADSDAAAAAARFAELVEEAERRPR